MRVLVVDDDRLVRAAMVRTLKRIEGLVVEDFGDGDAALERCENARFDVAILDLKMPVIDGVALAKKLRAADPAIRIVFVTADLHGELARRARELNPLALLAKPWTPQELMSLLRG